VTRRGALALLCSSAALLPSCGRPEPGAAARRGYDWLWRQQAPDGGIHSVTYGVLKPGHSLTALALWATALAPAEVRARQAGAIGRAFEFLARATAASGAVGTGGGVTDYPTYTSAFLLLALSELRPPGWEEAARRQVAFLCGMQISERGGWLTSDLAYGGFGFGGVAPTKPIGEQDVNLSVTSWVVTALRAAGVASDDETMRRARVFVRRCQQARALEGRPAGGFFFSPAAIENASKAGFAGPEKLENARAYGSTTCDGVAALVACGARRGDAELDAALGWLATATVETDRVPGFEAADRQHMGQAIRFYWLAALARVARCLESPDVAARAQRHLTALQRADGSWRNEVDLMKEDDPVVATALALLALSQ
jgi:hypothetical protein